MVVCVFYWQDGVRYNSSGFDVGCDKFRAGCYEV